MSFFGDFLKTQEVRDLYWILKGPGLLNPDYPAFADHLLRDEWFQENAQQGEKWFQACDENPKTLLEDLRNRKNPTTLLGRYFEALLSFWIREYMKPEAFRAGVPVHEHEASKPGQGRNTIGEFDFVFRLTGENPVLPQTYHWEASVKFYLFCGENIEQARQMNHYFGTYLKDRLDIKVGRIFNHQLKLSESLDGRNLLAHLGFFDPQPKAWIKGMLFYPAQSDWRNHPYPPEIAAHHSRGWWTQANELDVLAENIDNRWIILPKYRWLSPAVIYSSAENDQKLLTLDEMKDHCGKHFSEHLSPLMWAETKWDSQDQAWREVGRGLVVHFGWRAGALSGAPLG